VIALILLSQMTAQINVEGSITSTSDGFRVAVNTLRSLEGEYCVILCILYLREDCCVRQLVKNFGKQMPESAVREEQETLNISVHVPFNCAVVRGPELSKVRSHTGFCRLRVTVEKYVPLRAHCSLSTDDASKRRSGSAGTIPGASRLATLNSPVIPRPLGGCHNAQLRGRTNSKLSGL